LCRAFIPLGLPERPFLAFKFRKFIIGGEHKMLSWRPSNRCALNHDSASKAN
jgi:hypothetical protein